ncbi:MAG TPA: hypothetical protein VN618_12175 [Solirubrobacteraceae bacterium]|nr:hypothetical protein [Solirubrobacteraceae bacterium]
MSGTQTTSWSASGTREWCPSAAPNVPYDGSGSATIHVSGSETIPLAVGSPPTLPINLRATIERSGSLVEHFGALAGKAPECAMPTTGDQAAETSGCGRSAGSLPALISARGLPAARLTTSVHIGPGSDCPWIASVESPSEAGFSTFSAAVDSHQEALDGLQPISFPGLLAPREPPVAPVAAAGHASGSWQVALPGGALKVSATSEAQATIAPVAMIVPGHGISTIHLGETYGALRAGSARFGGATVSDSGMRAGDGRHYTWLVEAGVPELEVHGGNIHEGAWISAPAGSHRGPLWHGPPPAGARVAQVSTTGTYEVTATGAGEGSTLASLRRSEPRGHVIYFGRPIAWALDGPGRRRTAFILFGGVVQTVEVGCRQTDPTQRGAPVSDSAVC